MIERFVFDVTAANFQADVLDRSRTTPVLLDFWAEWCGPCKELGPLLEALAEEYGGGFVLGKVDTEAQPDLAQAFQVQGIPFCVLMDGGKPVDAFTGALRDTEVRRFLQRNAIPIKAAVAEPTVAAVAVDPQSPVARFGRALEFARRGDAASARRELDTFPDDDVLFERVGRLGDALAFLETALPATAPGPGAILLRARELLVAGEIESAMEQILESVAVDKAFAGGLARKGMLLCFQLFGEDEELVDDYRRRLATLLY
jgi:putative thioredoxin